MESSTKKILGTLAVAAAVGGGFYLIKRGKKLMDGAKMNFTLLGFRIHKINLQEVQFAIKLRCYNPTKEPITLAINQVVANYKGSQVAFSKPDIKGLTIQAGGTRETEILFQAPYLNLLGKGLTSAALNNIEQLKADLTFTLTLTINGETITTTQNLKDENMNGLALGELGIVSGPRNTQNGRKYNHLIKRADGQETYIKTGNVLETVEKCIDIIANHYREVEELAKILKGSSLKSTCRNIFNFAYTYLQYHKDKQGTEQLRTPARSWLDGQIKFKQKGNTSSGVDCDDYSIFVGSILKCLDIPFKIRITKYDGKKNFQHIYVFVPAIGDSENEIIIDPVLSKFDFQKPYTFEKSDFGMSPLQMVAGIHGVDGITGTTSLGLPIYALSGVDLAGGRMVDNDHNEMIAIVSGVDFENAINGLGSLEDATLHYLIRTRNFLLKKQGNKNKIAHIQNPDQFISMLNQAIKHWNTPQREKVLNKLADIEEKLTKKGFIKYDIDGIEGLKEFADFENEIDGLGSASGLAGFWGAIKRIGRGIGRGIKKVGQAIGKGVKKVGKFVGKVAKGAWKFIVRFNPLSIVVRNGLLAGLRLNMFGIAKKLQYAYLPDNLASKYNIDPNKLKDLKQRHNRVRKLFNGLQGRERNLKKAILKGAKQGSPDFSLGGINGVIARLQALEALGELAELGNIDALGVAVSAGAASGVLAKIAGWLKPVKNLFNKIRGKAAVKKIERLTKKGKKVSEKLRDRADKYKQEVSAWKQLLQKKKTKQAYTPVTRAIQVTNNYQPQRSKLKKNISRQNSLAPVMKRKVDPRLLQTATTVVPQNSPSEKNKMSKGAKVAIGLGVAALVGTGAYFLFRKKTDEKPKSKSKPKKSSEKKSLGSISLQ